MTKKDNTDARFKELCKELDIQVPLKPKKAVEKRKGIQSVPSMDNSFMVETPEHLFIINMFPKHN